MSWICYMKNIKVLKLKNEEKSNRNGFDIKILQSFENPKKGSNKRVQIKR